MNDLEKIKAQLTEIVAALWRIEQRQMNRDPNLEMLRRYQEAQTGKQGQ